MRLDPAGHQCHCRDLRAGLERDVPQPCPISGKGEVDSPLPNPPLEGEGTFIMNISVINLQRAVPIPAAKIKSAARKALLKLDKKDLLLSIVFVGERRMRMLNKAYLRHDFTTDVITFKHGEIIVCPAVAARHAGRYGNTIDKELALCVIHGILHLCGYDDHAPMDIRQMRRKEIEILKSIFPSTGGRG